MHLVASFLAKVQGVLCAGSCLVTMWNTGTFWCPKTPKPKAKSWQDGPGTRSYDASHAGSAEETEPAWTKAGSEHFGLLKLPLVLIVMVVTAAATTLACQETSLWRQTKERCTGENEWRKHFVWITKSSNNCAYCRYYRRGSWRAISELSCFIQHAEGTETKNCQQILSSNF